MISLWNNARRVKGLRSSARVTIAIWVAIVLIAEFLDKPFKTIITIRIGKKLCGGVNS
jgi:hypothetical protein